MDYLFVVSLILVAVNVGLVRRIVVLTKDKDSLSASFSKQKASNEVWVKRHEDARLRIIDLTQANASLRGQILELTMDVAGKNGMIDKLSKDLNDIHLQSRTEALRLAAGNTPDETVEIAEKFYQFLTKKS